MKRFYLILLVLAILTAGAYAQDYTASDLTGSFKDFSDQMAETLPLASTIGLNWNDASLAGFPHFGLGLTVGTVVIPDKAFSSLISQLGLTEIDKVTGTIGGMPIPVYSIDGRIGIPFLPMDVGVKVGVIPEQMKDAIPSDFDLNYTMIGADVRYRILKDNLLLPELSFGVGYTRLSGSISLPGPSSQTIDITSTGAGNTLEVSSSDIVFDWEANVFDFKLQASKKLLILNLSAGLGYTYGLSSAGGGFDADITVDGLPLTAAQQQALDALDIDAEADSLSIMSDANGGTLRAFGGVGLQIAVVKLDLGVVYGMSNGTLGASANVRVQF